MTTIVRWNPVRDMLRMRYDVDRLFDEFGGRTAPNRFEGSSWGLALDIAEKEDAFVVKASIPGVNPEDVDITINENTLTIQGQVKSDETIEEGQYHVRERRYGSFSRNLLLPKTVSRKEIEADYQLLNDFGFDDEDIWDIGAISAFFGLSNRIVNLSSMRTNDEFYLMGRVPRAKS